MQNKYIKILLTVLVIAFVVPQIVLAVWWNPVSWGIWGKIWGLFNKTENTQQEQIVGGDKDEHGCLGSAGYSWCEVKNKCLRVWEEKCEAATDVDVLKQISEDIIVDAINNQEGFQLKKNTQGKYEVIGPNGYPTYFINLITKGDLNNDGLQDAVIFGTGCGASCGSIFTVVINKNGGSADAFNVYPDGIILSSAAQNEINGMTIDNGIISINFKIWQPVSIQTLTYKFVDDKLVKIISTVGWKTYTDAQYGFELKYPSDWKFEQREFLVALKSPDFDYLNAEINSKVLNGSWITIQKAYTKVTSVKEYLGDDYVYIKDVKNIKVDNIDGIEFYRVYYNQGKLFVNFIKGNYLYLIIFEGAGEERKDRDYPTFEKIISTFKFTTPTVVATLQLWPDVNSFDLVNKSFLAKGMGGSAKSVKNIKVYINSSTKFSSKDMTTSMNNFQEMYTMMKDWVGFEWWFTIKGIYQEDGSFLANDISIAGQ